MTFSGYKARRGRKLTKTDRKKMKEVNRLYVLEVEKQRQKRKVTKNMPLDQEGN